MNGFALSGLAAGVSVGDEGVSVREPSVALPDDGLLLHDKGLWRRGDGASIDEDAVLVDDDDVSLKEVAASVYGDVVPAIERVGMLPEGAILGMPRRHLGPPA